MQLQDVFTGALAGALPGITAAFVVYLRARAKYLDAETALLWKTVNAQGSDIDGLKNGEGEKKVKDVLAKQQVLTTGGVYGRRTETINPETWPVEGMSEHAIKTVRNIMGGNRQTENAPPEEGVTNGG